jgi:hypothetical protein
MAKKSIQDLMYGELKDLSTKLDTLIGEIAKDNMLFERRISKIEVKAGLWGAASGLIGGILMALGFNRS